MDYVYIHIGGCGKTTNGAAVPRMTLAWLLHKGEGCWLHSRNSMYLGEVFVPRTYNVTGLLQCVPTTKSLASELSVARGFCGRV